MGDALICYGDFVILVARIYPLSGFTPQSVGAGRVGDGNPGSDTRGTGKRHLKLVARIGCQISFVLDRMMTMQFIQRPREHSFPV